MMIKTQNNVFVNMDKLSQFSVEYLSESDFAVIALKDWIDGRITRIELGRYETEDKAAAALEKLMQHTGKILKMPEISSKTADDAKDHVQNYIVDGKEYAIPIRVVDEIRFQDMVENGKNIAENRNLIPELSAIDPEWEEDEQFFYDLATEVEFHIDSTPAEDEVINLLKRTLKTDRENREKEKFVISYLLCAASDEEFADFMGKPTHLRSKEVIRDTIRQMPEDIFDKFYEKYSFSLL